MSAPRQWFRMYAEAVDDDKLRLLAFEDRWHFVALLCLKASGTIDSDAPHLERRIAVKLGLQLPQLDELKRRLMDVTLIDDNWQPIKWGDRQFESDVSTDRVRKHRSKQQGNVSEPLRNVSETPSEQSRAEQTQSRADTDRPRATPAGEMAIALRDLGVATTSDDPTLISWLRDGFTVQQATDAVGIARIRKPHPERIPGKYLDTILRSPARAPPEQSRPKTAHERLMEATK
jgi:hypothetical protein